MKIVNFISEVEQEGPYIGEAMGRVFVGLDCGGASSVYEIPCLDVRLAAKVADKLREMEDDKIISWLNQEDDLESIQAWAQA